MKKVLPDSLSANEKGVRELVLSLIKKGCPPSEISISAIQNPGLREWAKWKGIVWDINQRVDVTSPEEFGFREIECVDF